VSRAEFGTILSRAIWGDKNNGGVPYYATHLNALKNAGIMFNISDPEMEEVRGYIFLMLMRADEQLQPSLRVSIPDYSPAVGNIGSKGSFFFNTLKFEVREPAVINSLDFELTSMGKMKAIKDISLMLKGKELVSQYTIEGRHIILTLNDAKGWYVDRGEYDVKLFVSLDAEVGEEFSFHLSGMGHSTVSGEVWIHNVQTSTYRTTNYRTLSDITHTIMSNTITLTWKALSQTAKMDIFLFDPREERWEHLSEVNVSDEVFIYEAKRSGEHIFRLLSDIDIRYSLSIVLTSISAVKQKSDVKIWGSNGQLNVQTSSPQSLKVYNLSGQIVFQDQIEGERKILLQKGIYLVKAGANPAKKIVL
jgi:hypothetical protein